MFTEFPDFDIDTAGKPIAVKSMELVFTGWLMRMQQILLSTSAGWPALCRIGLLMDLSLRQRCAFTYHQ